MRLINPTKNNIEFRYGGQVYYFLPGESKELPEHVAKHALDRAKAPLTLHTPMYDKEVTISDIEYPKLPWKQLVHLASERGLFKPGNSREDVERILADYDREQAGTLQEPTP